ncbi:putative glyoxalase superfamily protein PhnB [Prauserella sediminis]|uniref:Putative glyoxalase superfamily protein PhnB n=1 Tax=Prauserella sediminis TaxID=577680 RepID=A0A839XJA4_9PSEU|nr:VOC family protein [Prauserella sediminis]MBB3662617.1 putative glyoxalase superfamily protein PhnB [Prauserella sediminis]
MNDHADPTGPTAEAETHALTPYLVVADARRAIEFYVETFGAVRHGEPIVMDDGRVGHAEVAIGDSVLMMAEEFPEIDHVAVTSGGPAVRVEVADVDDAVAKATALGAEVFGDIGDDGYGRSGRIRDPFGQRWLVQQASRRSSAGRS